MKRDFCANLDKLQEACFLVGRIMTYWTGKNGSEHERNLSLAFRKRRLDRLIKWKNGLREVVEFQAKAGKFSEPVGLYDIEPHQKKLLENMGF